MRARVVPLDDPGALDRLLDDVAAALDGKTRAVAIVIAGADGGLEVRWGATKALGPHAGTVLRGMVAYLAAVMDAEALAPAAAPIAYGGGDTWTP
jgi:hypothetical protein